MVTGSNLGANKVSLFASSQAANHVISSSTVPRVAVGTMREFMLSHASNSRILSILPPKVFLIVIIDSETLLLNAQD